MTQPPGRHAVVMGITITYVLVWAFGIASVFAAAAILDRTTDPDGADDAIGLVLMLVLAFIVGVVGGHVVWIVRTARVLGAYGRVGRTAATAVLSPVSLVLTSIAVNDSRLPWGMWPLVGVVVPAALSWWATEPTRSLDPGDR